MDFLSDNNTLRKPPKNSATKNHNQEELKDLWERETTCLAPKFLNEATIQMNLKLHCHGL